MRAGGDSEHEACSSVARPDSGSPCTAGRRHSLVIPGAYEEQIILVTLLLLPRRFNALISLINPTPENLSQLPKRLSGRLPGPRPPASCTIKILPSLGLHQSPYHFPKGSDMKLQCLFTHPTAPAALRRRFQPSP